MAWRGLAAAPRRDSDTKSGRNSHETAGNFVVDMFLPWPRSCRSAVAAAEDKNLDSAAARKIFAAPPREYATAPLWVWNDMLTDEQIRGTMRDLAGQKVMQVFVHPRPGLMTPYLSDEWFRLWKVALDEAEKLDMNVWIYDENSYPSGFAGGHVPETDARIARPRAGLPRREAGAEDRPRHRRRLPRHRRRAGERHREAPRAASRCPRDGMWWRRSCGPRTRPGTATAATST